MRAPSPTPCRSFDAVILALGGLDNVAHITRRTKAAVCNWRAVRGVFPAVHYAVIASELYRRGHYAPWKLFGFNRINDDVDAFESMKAAVRDRGGPLEAA